jgi:hypothetical protein
MIAMYMFVLEQHTLVESGEALHMHDVSARAEKHTARAINDRGQISTLRGLFVLNVLPCFLHGLKLSGSKREYQG